MFHQTGKVEAQVKFYDEKLKGMGWTKDESSEIVDGVAFLDFDGDGYEDLFLVNSMHWPWSESEDPQPVPAPKHSLNWLALRGRSMRAA